MSRNKNQSGFTLIELLVVVAIIALLSSVALIAFLSAREKSRNAKRLGDMTQMNTGLEIYWTYNKGYPDASSTPGVPDGIVPQFTASLPIDPTPADGNCDQLIYPNGSAATRYYYVPSGTPDTINGVSIYPSYNYYFCLGSKTGDFAGGIHVLTPTGMR